MKSPFSHFAVMQEQAVWRQLTCQHPPFLKGWVSFSWHQVEFHQTLCHLWPCFGNTKSCFNFLWPQYWLPRVIDSKRYYWAWKAEGCREFIVLRLAPWSWGDQFFYNSRGLIYQLWIKFIKSSWTLSLMLSQLEIFFQLHHDTKKVFHEPH